MTGAIIRMTGAELKAQDPKMIYRIYIAVAKTGFFYFKYEGKVGVMIDYDLRQKICLVLFLVSQFLTMFFQGKNLTRLHVKKCLEEIKLIKT